MPFRIQRTATFHEKEIFKTLPLDGTPTRDIVIDSTTVVAGADGRFVLEAGQVMCKAKTGRVNQVNTITVTATGGTFTVTVNAQTTAALAWNIPADDLLAAIEGLSSVAHGDVTVTLAGGVYTLTWVGTKAYTAVTVSLGVGSLTGGTATLATPTAANAGANGNLARPAASSGEASGDILGLLTHGVEFFYPVQAGITDEPAAVYFAYGNFDITKLVGYSGNAAAVQTALPTCLFN